MNDCICECHHTPNPPRPCPACSINCLYAYLFIEERVTLREVAPPLIVYAMDQDVPVSAAWVAAQSPEFWPLALDLEMAKMFRNYWRAA